MTASDARFAAGSMLQNYRLVESFPKSKDVWKAVDSRTSRDVVLKVLTRNLPSDKARRDAGIKKIRAGAAFYHPGVVRIIDLLADDDDLVLVMEPVSGTDLSTTVREHLPDKTTILKWAWQLADAIGAIHSHGLVHGAINGCTVVITSAGDVKIIGLSLKMLMDRRDRGGAELLQTEDEDRLMELSYFAPEQISGKMIDERADIFSYGAVLYETVTQRRAFQGENGTDLATSIVTGQPRQPYEINPRMHPGLIGIIGKCLAKDPYGRYASTKLIASDLRKIEPVIASIGARHLDGARGDTTVSAAAREAIILVADIPYYDLLMRESSTKALDIAAVMQQIIGEAVYLYEGKILDSEGARIVAALPDAESAVRALERARNDLLAANQLRSERGEDLIDPRVLVHAGQVIDEPLGGKAVEQAMLLLSSMLPGQMLVTQRPIHDSALASRSRQIGTLQGIALWEPPATVDPPASEAALANSAAISSAAKRPMALIASIAVGFAILVAAGLWLVLSKAEPPRPAVRIARAPLQPLPQKLRVRVEPFLFNTADPEAGARLESIEKMLRAVLTTVPDIHVVSEAATNVVTIGGRVLAEQPNALIPTLHGASRAEGPPVPLSTKAEALNQLLAWLSAHIKVAPEQLTAANPAAVEHFAQAIMLPRGSKERAQEIKAAITADPRFVPAARLALAELPLEQDSELLIRAGERVVEVDPTNYNARRALVRLYRMTQNPTAAVPHLVVLTAAHDRSAYTLESTAKLALAAGETALFTKAEKQLRSASPTGASVHAPDILAAKGRLDAAVQQYYAIEKDDPANKALALKIGRLAILRRSLSVADSELKKLQTLDPDYGFHLLSAYVAAEKGDSKSAAQELELARAAAAPDASIETSAAEVFAILRQHQKVIEALRDASRRSELTYAYVLSNPLFAYLRDDPAFAALRAEIEKKRNEMSFAVTQIRL